MKEKTIFTNRFRGPYEAETSVVKANQKERMLWRVFNVRSSSSSQLRWSRGGHGEGRQVRGDTGKATGCGSDLCSSIRMELNGHHLAKSEMV